MYLFFYTMPHLHWLLGDTAEVVLPEFAQQGSVFELVVILWLPFMLCLALVHQVLTVERARTRAALTDVLTGLPNRAGLHVALRQLSGDFTALVIYLNRFKSIDLALGRALGDEVLQGFAARLMRLRQATVARLHSDRFAMVLPGRFDTTDLVTQIDALLAEPLQVQGQVVDLSVTIGVSASATGAGLEQQMRQAEMALHHALQRHIAALRYDASLEQPRPTDLSLMSDLHQAVANQELRLFLQPKVRLHDGSVSSAEGLVRWQHPQRGMVPPNEFVNFAEQIGRIGFITQWVLQQAMTIVAQRRAAGSPLQISVNISAVDLADGGFVDLVSQLAAKTGAEPCDIKLEITESAAMEEPVRAMSAMQRLHDLGFKWSLDDFGTGYSSLSYLQKMPLSELKIDRSFVRDVTPDSDSAKLLGSVIALGHQLGLSVVAEGAETHIEWQTLKALGADMVQGWFAAKAMPLHDFLQWCEDHPRFGIPVSSA
jgi:diguanylate cyclase (GGDEF)-like protein